MSIRSQNGADTVRIAGRSHQPNAQSRLAVGVAIEPRRVCILRNGQIDAPVLIEVAHGRAPLFAVNTEAALPRAHRREAAPPVAFEQEAAARVVAGGFRIDSEKVLRQE